jgi:O-antigen ligase
MLTMIWPKRGQDGRRRRPPKKTSTFLSADLRLPRPQSVAMVLFAGVVLAAPFPVGSVAWTWIALWSLLIAVAVPFLDYSGLGKAQTGFLLPFFAAFGILLLYMLLQATGFAGLLPDNRLYIEARALLGRDISGYPTAAPTQSLLVTGGYALALLAFSGGFLLGTDGGRARKFILVIGLMGIANGLLGIALFYANPRQIFWVVLEQARGQPSGTFVNRNHAATLFACSTVIFFALTLTRVMADLPRGDLGWKQRWQVYLLHARFDFLGPLLLTLTGIVLTVITLSRGGMLGMLAGMATVYGLLVLRMGGRRWGIAVVLASAAFGFLLISQSRFGPYAERFTSQRLTEDGRFEIFKAVFRIIRDHPWFGTGNGTFEYIIPRYRPDTISPIWIWDYAHSGPLQILAELGIPMGLFALGLFITVIGVCARGLWRRKRDLAYPAIGAGVGVVALTHSLVDFSLQIPGFMIVFAAVFGACTAQAFPTRTGSAVPPQR